MRIKNILLLCIVFGLAAIAFGQQEQEQKPRLRGYFTVRHPVQVPDLATIQAESAKATTLPIWTFDVHSSRDGNNYVGAMVGRDPFNNPGSVSVPVYVIPLIIKTQTVGVSHNSTTGVITTKPGVTVFNPAVADTACLGSSNNVPTTLFQQSPLFNAATFDFGGTIVGTTEYSDAFQRGNFWQVLGSHRDEYHVLLNPVKFLSPIELTVPAVYGTTLPASDFPSCQPEGIIDINWFDALLTGSIIPSLAAQGINPANFPIFMVHNVVWASPATNLFDCCILGYHGITGVPTPTQTYSPLDFDSNQLFANGSGSTGPFSDTAVSSHEIDEWMDDPFTVNEVTPWGNVGQIAGCSNLLEVGDPLTGTEYPPIHMPNGFTYHLQELTFFRWFFGAPSISVNGWYSDNGTFLTDAGPPCS